MATGTVKWFNPDKGFRFHHAGVRPGRVRALQRDQPMDPRTEEPGRGTARRVSGGRRREGPPGAGRPDRSRGVELSEAKPPGPMGRPSREDASSNAPLLGPGDPAPDASLVNLDGMLEMLSTGWRERPAAVIFLRYFGCPICRQQVLRLRNDRERFERAGMEVVLVGHGGPEDARRFVEDAAGPVSGAGRSEPCRVRALRAERGSIPQVFGPQCVAPMVRAALQPDCRQGLPNGGNLMQMPGAFVVDTARCHPARAPERDHRGQPDDGPAARRARRRAPRSLTSPEAGTARAATRPARAIRSATSTCTAAPGSAPPDPASRRAPRGRTSPARCSSASSVRSRPDAATAASGGMKNSQMWSTSPRKTPLSDESAMTHSRTVSNPNVRARHCDRVWCASSAVCATPATQRKAGTLANTQ